MRRITCPARRGKVRGMNDPPVPGEERRDIPRHLRDGEHDVSRAAPGAGTRVGDAIGAARRRRGWIYLAVVALAVLAGLYFAFAA